MGSVSLQLLTFRLIVQGDAILEPISNQGFVTVFEIVSPGIFGIIGEQRHGGVDIVASEAS